MFCVPVGSFRTIWHTNVHVVKPSHSESLIRPHAPNIEYGGSGQAGPPLTGLPHIVGYEALMNWVPLTEMRPLSARTSYLGATRTALPGLQLRRDC